MQSSPSFTIQPFTEKCVVVQFDPTINETTLTKVLSFKNELTQNSFEGMMELVPSYCSVIVYYNPAKVMKSELFGSTAFDRVSRYLKSIKIDNYTVELNVTKHVVPVCYDPKCGLDQSDLSKSLDLSVDTIIDIHSKAEYTVYLIGFTPGFPYMGILPNQLECKRKENPRKKVPAGSVGIAGKQTGIYPFETPGGWQIIGRTPVQLFSIDRDQPSLFKAGDKVKFEPISFREFEILSRP